MCDNVCVCVLCLDACVVTMSAGVVVRVLVRVSMGVLVCVCGRKCTRGGVCVCADVCVVIRGGDCWCAWSCVLVCVCAVRFAGVHLSWCVLTV